MILRNLIHSAMAVFGSPHPIILFHQPTALCDCKCKFCNAWMNQPVNDDILSTNIILRLLYNAYRAGITSYTIWGGEPLAAVHLPEWLRYAKTLGIRTTICTSGSRLKERAAEIGPYLDILLLSLEAVGKNQDKIRGKPGLFDHITEGISAFRRHSKANIILWTNLTKENNDQTERIAEFAAANRLLVEFFPASRHLGYNNHIILDPIERDKVFRTIMRLKRRGYPIHNTWHALRLMKSCRPFICNMPRVSIQVMPDGEIYACDPRLIKGLDSFGNIKNISLASIPSSDLYSNTINRLRSCNRCLLPCVANLTDSLSANSLSSALNKLYYRFVLRFGMPKRKP